MDSYSLVATNAKLGDQPGLKDAKWEDRYYAEFTRRRIRPRLLGSIFVFGLLILAAML